MIYRHRSQFQDSHADLLRLPKLPAAAFYALFRCDDIKQNKKVAQLYCVQALRELPHVTLQKVLTRHVAITRMAGRVLSAFSHAERSHGRFRGLVTVLARNNDCYACFGAMPPGMASRSPYSVAVLDSDGNGAPRNARDNRRIARKQVQALLHVQDVFQTARFSSCRFYVETPQHVSTQHRIWLMPHNFWVFNDHQALHTTSQPR